MNSIQREDAWQLRGVLALELTGKASAVGVIYFATYLPQLLLSFWSGVVADRCSRSTVLGLSVWTRAVVGGLLVAGLAAAWPVAWLVGLAAVLGVLATPSYPALLAATRQLVPDRDLPPANALVTGIENAAWIAGPGLLGVLLVMNVDPSVANLTAAVLSDADTLDKIIAEIAATRLTERGATRGDDRVSEAAMEDRKREGYF